MTNFCVGGVDISEYIWNDEHINCSAAILIDRAVVALDAKAIFHRGGPGHPSGIFWGFYVKKNGTPTDHDEASFVVGEDERWKIALSFRGPFITALSWRDLDSSEDKVTSPALVAMVKKLAEELRLTYLDAHELWNLEIPWAELQNGAEMRLDDWGTTPNAFNLLFYEY